MSTLTVMKARIADELARSDLTSQIGYAITDAIAAYQDEEFDFSEQRFSFPTVVDREFYTSADHVNIPLMEKIEFVKLYISDTPTELEAMTPSRIEAAQANGIFTGDPSGYCFMPESTVRSLRLYPIPAAVRTVRIFAKVRPAAPATDGEANNYGMTEGERLIRCRAKFEVFKHVIRNAAKADEMIPLVQEAFDQLKNRFMRRTRTGDSYAVEPTDF